MNANIQPGSQLLASVIIASYNRRDALLSTLRALGKQSVAPERYEVIVADDGSVDDTFVAASELQLPCTLRILRHRENRGVSAARNTALVEARGRYLILLSDDLVVPEDFIATHVETLERFPGFWVVGGFQQLPSLTESAFGRYLDGLEIGFAKSRKTTEIAPNLWEMSWPTARNLSLPRVDYEKIGPFDEQFTTTCEDQDWAERARGIGIRFLYNSTITCLHNDQAAELRRYCRFQKNGARDTVRFCRKYPERHGGAAIARRNGYCSLDDGVVLTVLKLIKRIASASPIRRVLERTIVFAERWGARDGFLWPMYRWLIGLYIFLGWREGLRRPEHFAAGASCQIAGARR